jgi:outer membrane receptor protein involved in Fe transport
MLKTLNTKILSIVLFILVFMPSLLKGQANAVFRGTVKDAKTGEPLIGASVGQKGTSFGASTDYEGSFQLKLPQPFPVTIIVTYVGYVKQELVVNSGSRPIEIRLKENSRELKEVAIRDSRVTQKQKQAPLTVETMDAIAIKETPAANFYEGLAHLKGVDLTSASIGFKIINTRGFNSTSPVRSLQLIDGVDNQAPGLNFSLGNFLGSSELDVQKVDLIVGASGAYYGPNAFNGVINMQTKNPFLFPGLSAQIKVGERKLTEVAVRYAEVIKNKKGEEKLAYKINLSVMSARDWEANNYQATEQSPTGVNNPGGYDAVNIYGDENSYAGFRQTGLPFLGHGYALRGGYKEVDLVDYNTRNLKMGAALHYKVKKDQEIIYAFNYGSGTTVYQGDNRFSLKDITFFQNRVEWRKENNFFIRTYMTKENAGNSYDAYATALLLQNAAKLDADWASDYANYWSSNVYNKIEKIRPPLNNPPPGVNYGNYANYYLNTYYLDSLTKYHQQARSFVDANGNFVNGGLPRFEPGTQRFDSAFASITSRTNREGGSRFFDESALYHIVGEKQFQWFDTEFRIGGNYRLYAPLSKGSIFLDTIANQRIFNQEVGAYMGVEHKFLANKLKVSFTGRADKNQNFALLFSPAASAVYTYKEHVIRFSAASAIRNPTLTDQYINLNVGRATLLGNLSGFDSLVTIPSMIDAFNFGKNQLSYFNVAPIRPERVKTIEFGYRANLFEKWFADLSYYYSWYTDFIGYKIGADITWEGPLPEAVKVYRVSTNAVDQVTTQGFTIGLNYFFKKGLGFNGNYSWNKLDRQGSTDPLIPAFNTPEHKYNLGISGRGIESKIGNIVIDNWGYGINWKWQTGFLFEGSPQFTGTIPAYGMLDAQFNKTFPKDKLTLKMGANNILNNKVIQVYGGPLVGRLAYISVLLDLGN